MRQSVSTPGGLGHGVCEVCWASHTLTHSTPQPTNAVRGGRLWRNLREHIPQSGGLLYARNQCHQCTKCTRLRLTCDLMRWLSMHERYHAYGYVEMRSTRDKCEEMPSRLGTEKALLRPPSSLSSLMAPFPPLSLDHRSAAADIQR